MGATFSVVKTLIVPALISLILFLVSTYLLVPLWQHYRIRYSQYLPLETISNQTLSIRHRVQNAIANIVIPSAWRFRREHVDIADGDSDAGFDSDEGEELGEVDDSARSGREQERHSIDNTRRLSRDLEEGFRDDSDEESEDGRSGRR
ncbi:hypothetical protein B0H63DRAFT_479038 [Podospora didyma]|uniref:Uncharacterized protein n=1 Tax=Podospora didyma TaxID=330526 RepID=A0AAE0NBQ9_9PEZI|nr:hypothetical protein B0H63DRAFT_479038 [Podospora didyma]